MDKQQQYEDEVMEAIITFRVPSNVHKKVEEKAEMKEQTLSDYMRGVLYQQLTTEP